MDRFLASLAAAAVATALGACGSPESAPALAAALPSPAEAAPLAEQVSIEEIAVYQSVKVTVVKDGAVAKPNAPLIAGRPALVRAHVKRLDQRAHKLVAELRITRAGKDDLVLRDGPKSLRLVRDDGDLETTYNFKIEAADVTPDAALSLRVAESPEATEAVAFPASGKGLALDAKTASGTLRVKFVPVQYDMDGSGRTPDLKDVAVYRDALYNLYPTAKVEISVREALPWTQTIAGNGQGWDRLLDAIIQLRARDRAPDDVYYVGVFTPTEDLRDFCGQGQGGCVLGVAPAAELSEVGLRVAMITGYRGTFAGGTLAQELAHAMGRAHAPCGGAAGPDPDYPYARGSIGTWGYNLLKEKLVDPERARDFLSYCDPVWVSDYTFAGLYERMAEVTQTATARSQHGSVQSFRLHRDGSVTEGPIIEVLPGDPVGDSLAVNYEDGAGRIIATVNGRVRKIDGRDGSVLVLAPHAPRGAARARVGGRGAVDIAGRR